MCPQKWNASARCARSAAATTPLPLTASRKRPARARKPRRELVWATASLSTDGPGRVGEQALELVERVEGAFREHVPSRREHDGVGTPRNAQRAPRLGVGLLVEELELDLRIRSAAEAAAMTAAGLAAGHPIREGPPKQPQGDPPRPRAIATTTATAKSPSSPAAPSAAPGTSKATAAADPASAAIVPAQKPARADAASTPYERNASRARPPARSLAAAAASSRAASERRRRPTTVRGRGEYNGRRN